MFGDFAFDHDFDYDFDYDLSVFDDLVHFDHDFDYVFLPMNFDCAISVVLHMLLIVDDFLIMIMIFAGLSTFISLFYLVS